MINEQEGLFKTGGNFASIIHVPLLTDPTVNPNIIPGICKTLERYYLVYHMAEIINDINSNYQKALGSKMRIKSGKFVLEQVTPEKQAEFDRRVKEFERRRAEREDGGIKPKSKDKENVKKEKEISLKADIVGPTAQQISLEPTYIRVDTNQELRMIGIKVIPYYLKSTTSLVNLLTRESHFNWLQRLLLTKIRGTISNTITLMRTNKIAFRDPHISGDIRRDVLWGAAGDRGLVFMLLNAKDLQGMSFEEINIRRLHRLHWSSFIIADDVMQNVKFCMRMFKGLCSEIPYAFLYNVAGGEAMKSYADLSDVKKSVSPLFRMKRKTRKLFGESLAKIKLEKFKRILKENDRK